MAAILKRTPQIDIVRDGLVCWLDARDGSGTQTEWVDRSGNGNNATLTNFNFDENGGWTGKGLKFDGVNDFAGASVFQQDLKISEISVGINFMSTNTKVGTNSMFFLSDKERPSEEMWANSCSVYQIDNQRLEFQKPNTTRPIFYNGDPLNIDFDLFISGGKVYLNGIYKFELTGEYLNSISKYIQLSRATGNNAAFICYSIKIYNRALTDEEIQQNYEYEQSIDRTTPTTYPLLQEEKSYGIGLANQLSEEQLKIFRLSLDKTKFVAGLRYCEGLEVTEYTYSEVLEVMETVEWKSLEIV